MTEPAGAVPRKVILDCDPGIDDAFAIAFACGHPGLELCGVTTVAGNVGVDRTTANALAVLEFLGRAGVPVAAGSPAPLLRPFADARDVHGESGLGSARLPAPQGRPAGNFRNSCREWVRLPSLELEKAAPTQQNTILRFLLRGNGGKS